MPTAVIDSREETDGPVLLDRAGVEELVRSSPARCSIERIEAAIARADFEDGVARALARLKVGEGVPAELLASLLPGVTDEPAFLTLVHFASGDVASVLRRLLAERRFRGDSIGFSQSALALYGLWRLGPAEAVRPFLLPFVRDRARLPRRTLGQEAVAWLAHELADPLALELLDTFGGDFKPAERQRWASAMEDAFAMPLDEMIAELPEREATPQLPGVTLRAVALPGRNDLCPCGSGKKFKRCHADRPDEVVAAAPSRREQLAEITPRLHPDQLGLLTRADQAALDLDRLRLDTLRALLRCHTLLHDWPRARAAVEALRRRPEGDTDDWYDELMLDLLHARRFDLARELVPAIVLPESRAEVELTLALASDEPDALARVRAPSRAVLADASGNGVIELAHTLSYVDPALAILVARAAIAPGRALDAELLLEMIEQARVELGLSPWDPAHDTFESLFDDEEAQQPDRDDAAAPDDRELATTAANLRAEIDRSTARLAALQEQAAERERDLRRAQAAAAAQRTDAGEEEKRRLRDKVDELQSLIAAGNAERAALRRQLADANDTADRPHAERASRRGPDDAEDDFFERAGPEGGRRPLLPRIGDRAAAAFEQNDQKAVAMALRHVGALAAGDTAAWRGAKQAKDMPRQVLMVRIGIHHRLLFRADAGALEIIDFVTRENLMTTLKRLRSG
jgi:hypothetical protein